jgi:hypothetical protein
VLLLSQVTLRTTAYKKHNALERFIDWLYNNPNFNDLSGEEITLEYQFKVDSELEPEKFRLAHTVFYESDKRPHSTTFFNQVNNVDSERLLCLT